MNLEGISLHRRELLKLIGAAVPFSLVGAIRLCVVVC